MAAGAVALRNTEERRCAGGSGCRVAARRGDVAGRTPPPAEREPAGRQVSRECAAIFSSRYGLDDVGDAKDTFAGRLFCWCDFIWSWLREWRKTMASVKAHT